MPIVLIEVKDKLDRFARKFRGRGKTATMWIRDRDSSAGRRKLYRINHKLLTLLPLSLVLLVLVLPTDEYSVNRFFSVKGRCNYDSTHSSSLRSGSQLSGKKCSNEKCFLERKNQINLLLECGDIISQPGPAKRYQSHSKPSTNARTSSSGQRTPKHPCSDCAKGVTAASKAVSCDGCNAWTHLRRTNGSVTLSAYNNCVAENKDLPFLCSNCLFQSLPFSNGGDDDDDGDDDVFNAEARNRNSSTTGNATNNSSWSAGLDTQLDAVRGKGLLFVHANVRSLLPKLPEISLFLQKTKAAIFAITETWIDSSVPNGEINIDGYSVIRKDRNRHGGGVCLYIRNGINFDVRNISVPSIECVLVDILLPKTKPITFATFYRPPRDNNFIEKFQSVLDSLDHGNEIYLMGDFNICYKQKSALYKSYYELLQSFSLRQLICEPTRITSDSSTIIDHVICNPAAKICTSGVLNVSLSDHQFTFLTRGRIHSPCLNPAVRKFRSLKRYCKESFCNLLREVDWNCVLLETDVNLALDSFNSDCKG